jgi:predicted transcriptional regulator
MTVHSHDYPDEPGHRGVDTSIEAAKAIVNAAGRLQRMALFAIREMGPRGLTSQELADRIGVDFASIQPRTSELRRLGLIDDSGLRRPNRNGKRAIVWIAVSNGGAA